MRRSWSKKKKGKEKRQLKVSLKRSLEGNFMKQTKFLFERIQMLKGTTSSGVPYPKEKETCSIH